MEFLKSVPEASFNKTIYECNEEWIFHDGAIICYE
jgi:hypothetical protein